VSPNNSKRGVAGEVIKQRREYKIEKINLFYFFIKIKIQFILNQIKFFILFLSSAS
jgi:hypothetical protein